MNKFTKWLGASILAGTLGGLGATSVITMHKASLKAAEKTGIYNFYSRDMKYLQKPTDWSPFIPGFLTGMGLTLGIGAAIHSSKDAQFQIKRPLKPKVYDPKKQEGYVIDAKKLERPYFQAILDPSSSVSLIQINPILDLENKIMRDQNLIEEDNEAPLKTYKSLEEALTAVEGELVIREENNPQSINYQKEVIVQYPKKPLEKGIVREF